VGKLSRVTATQVRALVVETTPVDDLDRLLPLIDSADPLLWLRGGDGLAGVGTALRLEFDGSGRMTDAAAAWRQVVADSTVVDPVGLPGTGLVAFGAFAFSASSAATSVLTVPEVILGRRGGAAWVTRVRPIGIDADGEARVVGDAASPLGLRRDAAAAGSGDGRTALSPGAMGEDAYRTAVRDALARISAGSLSKVVVARDLVGALPTGADLRRPLRELAGTYPDCWTFAVDGLIGASPETLVQVADGRVSARVLAGTTGRGVDSATDRAAAAELLASDKNQEEHSFALRSVLASLGPHAADLQASERPFPLELPNLWHLASDISGTLGDASSSLDLLDALHPTAAVAGSPTTAALAAIEELEPFDRGRYAGPVGWVGADGEGEWAVALRCVQVLPNGRITAYAGAGIVAGSDPDAELAETDIKFRPVLDAFAL
jgi:menaquinone-specific isochorismate synthase